MTNDDPVCTPHEPAPIDAAPELRANLKQFTGSDKVYRHTMIRGFAYTEGVRYLATRAEAYWLIDAIASWQPQIKRGSHRPDTHYAELQDFQIWTFLRNLRGGGRLECWHDFDERKPGVYKTTISQPIPFTDFPLAGIKLYAEHNGIGHTLMLPSER